MFTTVPFVAPAPGMPPKTAAIALPIPCPISSRRPSCRSLVRLSAITEVSSESIDPSRASVSPLCNTKT